MGTEDDRKYRRHLEESQLRPVIVQIAATRDESSMRLYALDSLGQVWLFHEKGMDRPGWKQLPALPNAPT